MGYLTALGNHPYLKYGIEYLTFLIASSKAQAGVKNNRNDVYDGIVAMYKEMAAETLATMNKDNILNIDKEELSEQSLSYADSCPLY